MRISNAGLEFISRFEGLGLKAYRDPVGILTIGFGHTGPDVHQGLTISRARAFELLREDTSGAAAQVNRRVSRPLSQPQFDALVSLVFNAGTAPLDGTLGRKLNAGDFAGAHAEFGRWVKGRVHGQLVTLEGLVRRRAAEAAMFNRSSSVDAAPTVLNRDERKWVTRYDTLIEANEGTSSEAKELREKMIRQRKVLWRRAQPIAAGGDGNGWHFNHRVERYRALLARTA